MQLLSPVACRLCHYTPCAVGACMAVRTTQECLRADRPMGPRKQILDAVTGWVSRLSGRMTTELCVDLVFLGASCAALAFWVDVDMHRSSFESQGCLPVVTVVVRDQYDNNTVGNSTEHGREDGVLLTTGLPYGCVDVIFACLLFQCISTVAMGLQIVGKNSTFVDVVVCLSLQSCIPLVGIVLVVTCGARTQEEIVGVAAVAVVVGRWVVVERHTARRRVWGSGGSSDEWPYRVDTTKRQPNGRRVHDQGKQVETGGLFDGEGDDAGLLTTTQLHVEDGALGAAAGIVGAGTGLRDALAPGDCSEDGHGGGLCRTEAGQSDGDDEDGGPFKGDRFYLVACAHLETADYVDVHVANTRALSRRLCAAVCNRCPSGLRVWQEKTPQTPAWCQTLASHVLGFVRGHVSVTGVAHQTPAHGGSALLCWVVSVWFVCLWHLLGVAGPPPSHAIIMFMCHVFGVLVPAVGTRVLLAWDTSSAWCRAVLWGLWGWGWLMACVIPQQILHSSVLRRR